MRKVCSVEGCGRGGRITRGLCARHYQRQVLDGVITTRKIARRGFTMDFITNVALPYEDKNSCLFWPLPFKKTNGTLSRNVGGKGQTLSRYVCILSKGEPPEPKSQALHSCGNGHLACLNPHHIRWGSVIENMMDRDRHGNTVMGVDINSAILNPEKVREIRRLWQGGVKVKELSGLYGVGKSTIRAVVKRQSWKSVE